MKSGITEFKNYRFLEVFTEIAVLKTTVDLHSEQIKEIQLKQV